MEARDPNPKAGNEGADKTQQDPQAIAAAAAADVLEFINVAQKVEATIAQIAAQQQSAVSEINRKKIEALKAIDQRAQTLPIGAADNPKFYEDMRRSQ